MINMNELTQVVMQGVLSVLVVLIGLLFKELKRFLEVKSIAQTVVEAVEQVYKDVVDASQDKLASAEKRLTSELEAKGIYIDDNAKRMLIESVVNGMNELKNI